MMDKVVGSIVTRCGGALVDPGLPSVGFPLSSVVVPRVQVTVPVEKSIDDTVRAKICPHRHPVAAANQIAGSNLGPADRAMVATSSAESWYRWMGTDVGR
jgi:hypothetical protein